MRVKATHSANDRRSLHLEVERADSDGDVYLQIDGCYLDCASAQRLAHALVWASTKQPKKRKEALR